MRRLAPAGLAVLLAGGFYLLLVDITSLPELYALAGVALIAAVAFEISRRQGIIEAAVTITWLFRAWRPISRVPADIGLVCHEAVAQLLRPKRARGEFRAVRFTGGEGALDYGRRALSESLGSFAPNTIVVGVDPDRELLLVHQLHREGAREIDILRLG
jgi:hypothetical protein